MFGFRVCDISILYLRSIYIYLYLYTNVCDGSRCLFARSRLPGTGMKVLTAMFFFRARSENSDGTWCLVFDNICSTCSLFVRVYIFIYIPTVVCVRSADRDVVRT